MPDSVRSRIAAARDTLVRAGLQPADAAFDAEVLARHTLGWDRATLVAQGRESSPAGFESAFEAVVARRAAREPVAMILGMREFWGLDFEVTTDVLVPRPETELIVEEVLEEFPHAPRRIVDIGTGSGCLAVALAREFGGTRVVATDISASALAVARRNAAKHGVVDRIGFVRTSFLAGLGGQSDLIVSNPPYVPDAARRALAPEIVRFEPHTAVFGGEDGLAPIREILATAADRLTPAGRLIVEFGLGQEPEVSELAGRAGWRVIRVREDLQGIARTMVLGRTP